MLNLIKLIVVVAFIAAAFFFGEYLAHKKNLVQLKGFNEKDSINKKRIDKLRDSLKPGMLRHFLSGTAILPSTHGQGAALGYGLTFYKVTKTDCKRDGVDQGGNDRINSIIKTDSSLIIDMTIYDNCCYDFLCDISVDSTSTLNLIYNGYGTFCFCNCCHGLTYHLSVEHDEEWGEVKAVMINGDKKTWRRVK